MSSKLFLVSIVFFICERVFSAPCNISTTISGTAFAAVNSQTFDAQYQANRTCNWLIYKANQNVQIFFTTFRLAFGDYLLIYDGNSISAPLVGNFTGDVVPVPIRTNEYMFISFITSPNSVTANGFSANVVSGQCSQAVNIGSSSGVFSDGSSALTTYDLNLDCHWIIRPQDPAVSFFTIHLIRSVLSDDPLYIFDGSSTSGTLLLGTSGTSGQFNNPIITSGPIFHVQFTSNNINSGYGFDLQFNSVVNGKCDGRTIYNPSQGMVTSGNVGSTYQSNLYCEYLINRADGSIDLFFEVFDLSTSSSDYVAIYSGVTASVSNLIAKYSGKTCPSPLRLEISQILIVFVSDGNANDNGKGFKAKYFTGYYCSYNIVTCASNGFFTSGNPPTSNYPDGEECRWLIRPSDPGVTSITITFDRFAIYPDNYDFMYIYDGSTLATPLLNGANSPPASPLVSTSSSVLVRLLTRTGGGSGTSTGFQLKFTSSSSCSPTTYTNILSGQITFSGSPTCVCEDGLSRKRWIISSSDPLMQITVYFHTYNLLDGDVLNVYDASVRKSSTLLTSISGASPNGYSGRSNPVYSTSNSVLVEVVLPSGSTSSRSTFTISYILGSCANDVILITSTQGLIKDGSGMKDYQNNISCFWLIAPSPIQPLIITFVIENNGLGVGDSISFYDGTGTNAPLLYSLNSTSSLTFLQTSSQSLYMQFASDTTNPGRGFEASYFYGFCADHDDSVVLQSFPSGCFSDGGGINGTVRPNANCFYLIQPQARLSRRIDLQFLSFSGTDKTIRVYDYPTPNPLFLITTLSTNVSTYLNSTISAYSGQMLVQFSTGTNPMGCGFVAHYRVSNDCS